MGRKYSGETYFETVHRLKTEIPGVCIGADVIVGFPGEDEQAFEVSMGSIRDAKLSYLHVFPYSSRPGTPAAAMGGKVPDIVKRERARRLRWLSEELKHNFESDQIGKRLDVIVERNKRNSPEIGLISDNYVRFRIPRARWNGLGRFKVRMEEGMLRKRQGQKGEIDNV